MWNLRAGYALTAAEKALNTLSLTLITQSCETYINSNAARAITDTFRELFRKTPVETIFKDVHRQLKQMRDHCLDSERENARHAL